MLTASPLDPLLESLCGLAVLRAMPGDDRRGQSC